MKFFCEYCGNRIDAELDNKCPNCGASYKKNKSFIALEEERKKETELQNANKQKLFDHVLGTFKFSRWFLLIPVGIFILAFCIIIFIFSQVSKSFDSRRDGSELIDQMENFYDTYNSYDEEKIKDVTAGFDEFATTPKYRVKVNKYNTIDDNFRKAEDGYEIIEFHLLVENLTDNEIDTEDVNCIVDGVAQKNYYYSGHSDLPFDISRKLTVKGTSKFIVPKSAESYDIKYGDYVTIHIEK